MRAMSDVFQGRLDEAAAQLAVAATYVETAPPDRQRRLRVAIASVRLSLARRRGHLAGVTEQAKFLASPVTGQSDEDIALGSDLRAVALYNLGIVEAWSLGVVDGERHLREGAVLAREIGRPYLEVGCLALLGFASRIRSFATTGRRRREAIALADRYGWGTAPIVAPALVMLAGANRLGSPSFRSTAAEIALGPCAEAGDAARDYPRLVHGLDQLDRLVEALSLSGRPAAAP